MKHLGTIQLETDRLVLRRFTIDDAESVFKNWASDDEGEAMVGKMYYTGQKLTPAVVVKNGEHVLTQGVDYSISYQNNINCVDKKATQVSVKGLGNYTTTFTLPFTIVPAPISWAYAGNNKYQTGKKPAPVLTYNGKKLGNKDYTQGAVETASETTPIVIDGESVTEGTFVKIIYF